MLPDSGHLQEEDAERANRYAYSKHHPALPLYTRDDALRALDYLVAKKFDSGFDVTEGVGGLLRPAGHILGGATVELALGREQLRLVYSGDLGRAGHAFLRPPAPVRFADVLLLESTYGDRSHEPNPEDRLALIVSAVAASGGTLVVPAFAVGRTQELLWLLRRLQDARKIPTLPVYVDSPMAIDATEITTRDPESLAVDPAILRDPARNPLRSSNIHFTRAVSESKAINDLKGPVIIISASGMATGGRVLHHLKLRLPDSRTTVLLPGFQAAGTRGEKLQNGATEVRIHGQMVPVRARIETIDGLSAHADRDGLLDWLAGFERPPAQIFLVHGEPAQAEALARAITARFHQVAVVARDAQSVELPASGALPRARR
jgi:metallo-beta-lactamase family protein